MDTSSGPFFSQGSQLRARKQSLTPVLTGTHYEPHTRGSGDDDELGSVLRNLQSSGKDSSSTQIYDGLGLSQWKGPWGGFSRPRNSMVEIQGHKEHRVFRAWVAAVGGGKVPGGWLGQGSSLLSLWYCFLASEQLQGARTYYHLSSFPRSLWCPHLTGELRVASFVPSICGGMLWP